MNWQNILRILLVPFLPKIITFIFGMVMGGVNNGIAWLEAKAASTTSPIDDELVAAFKQLVNPASPNAAVTSAMEFCVRWLYTYSQQTDNAWDDSLVKAMAGVLGVDLK